MRKKPNQHKIESLSTNLTQLHWINLNSNIMCDPWKQRLVEISPVILGENLNENVESFPILRDVETDNGHQAIRKAHLSLQRRWVKKKNKFLKLTILSFQRRWVKKKNKFLKLTNLRFLRRWIKKKNKYLKLTNLSFQRRWVKKKNKIPKIDLPPANAKDQPFTHVRINFWGGKKLLVGLYQRPCFTIFND